jgi:hypothetical protein
MDEINQTRLAELRAKRAARRTMELRNEAEKIKFDLQKERRARYSALMKKVLAALKVYGVTVLKYDYDGTPNAALGGYFWAEFSLDMGHPAEKGEVVGTIQDILGNADWKVSRGKSDRHWYVDVVIGR